MDIDIIRRLFVVAIKSRTPLHSLEHRSSHIWMHVVPRDARVQYIVCVRVQRKTRFLASDM